AVIRFSDWCVEGGLRLADLRPLHAAAYIEHLVTAAEDQRKLRPTPAARKKLTAPTVKQHLAALRMLGDYLVTGHVIETNFFAPVHGPKYVVRKGKTPVLTAEEMKHLLGSINLKVDEDGRIVAKPPHEFTLAELRDRALLGVMVYSFARITAVLGM